ncbi:MAG: hypothetical protein BGO97_12610 [Micrococcales bacterium 70-64]|nr:copper resistance protein CopC [Leifsonia sp.]ODU64791.1 MAG: hypothetical protein ABT06_12610 [Leifsonia sp. SCN 70-46]OJX86482.1 MAG: hypothetical protein BGO97_12610 [Micrococcales bacterium 70-64]
MTTPLRLAALGAVVVAASVLGLAAPAQAHNYLVSSTPEQGSTITELPDRFSVTTNGPLLALDGVAGFALEVRDADGRYYGDGCVTVEGPTLSEAAPALGAAGDYVLLWQLVSEDGHTVSGEVDFTWAPAEGVEPAAGAASPATCGNAAEEPAASSPPQEVRGNADLGDVLWIGGAIAAVLAAALVTFLVVTRRRK